MYPWDAIFINMLYQWVDKFTCHYINRWYIYPLESIIVVAKYYDMYLYNMHYLHWQQLYMVRSQFCYKIYFIGNIWTGMIFKNIEYNINRGALKILVACLHLTLIIDLRIHQKPQASSIDIKHITFRTLIIFLLFLNFSCEMHIYS